MPWSMQMPDGSFVSDIPDDVTEEMAKQKIPLMYPEYRQFAERTVGNVAKDIGITALKSAIGVPKAIAGLGDLVGFDATQHAKALGVDFDKAQQILDSEYSTAQKAAKLNVQDAKGFVDTAVALAQNPSVPLQFVGESLGQMVGGAGIARGAITALPRIGAAVAAGLGEGAITAGSAASDYADKRPDGLTTKDRLAALGQGVGTGMLGFVGAKIAQKFGIADVDTMLATREVKDSADGFFKSLVKGGISEGAFEEMPQSAQEQMWNNWQAGRPITEGVPEAAAVGLVTGAIPGGAMNVLKGYASEDPSEFENVRKAFVNALDDAISSTSLDGINVDAQTDKNNTANVDITQSLARFRNETSSDLTSNFIKDVGAKLGIATIEQGDTAQVQDALTNLIVADPARAHQVIMANIDVLDKADVNVHSVVLNAVNQQLLTQKQGATILQRAAKGFDLAVDNLQRIADDFSARYDRAYAAKLPDFLAAHPKNQFSVFDKLNNFAEQISLDLGTLPMQEVDAKIAAIPDTVISPAIKAELKSASLSERQKFFAVVRAVSSGMVGPFGFDNASNARTSPAANLGSLPSSVDFRFDKHAMWFGSRGIDEISDFGHDKGKKLTTAYMQGKTGRINIVGKPNKKLYALLRRWATTHAAGLNITLVLSPTPVRGHMQLLTKDHAKIVIDANSSEADQIMTLAHEFGHALFMHHYFNSTQEVREAVRGQWIQHISQHWNDKAGHYQRMSFGNTKHRIYVDDQQTVGDVILRNMLAPNAQSEPELEFSHYIANFWEWQAGMMEKALVADWQDMQAPLRAFWKRALIKLEAWFRDAHRYWMPEQTIADFLALGRMRAARDVAETAVQDQYAQAVNVGLDVTVPGAPTQPSPEMNSGVISEDNSPQLPPAELAVATKLHKAMQQAAPNGGAVVKDMVRFSNWMAKFLAPYQILQRNAAIPGVTQFLNALRNKLGYKSNWLRQANRIAHDWDKNKIRANALAKLLLSEAEERAWFSQKVNGIYIVDQAKAQQFGLDDEGMRLYNEVRTLFDNALNSMEQLGVERIERQFIADPTNPQKQEQLRELQQSYANMRSLPYTPFSRFGRFYVKVKAKAPSTFVDPKNGRLRTFSEGETIYFETFDTAADAKRAASEIFERFKQSASMDVVHNVGEIHEIVYSVRNLPPRFVDEIAIRLGLSKQQIQEYNDLIRDLAADTSFAKHMKHKVGVEGYSADVLRGFADYFMRFSNNYAKAKSAPEFDDALRTLRQHKQAIVDSGGIDTVKIDNLYNWAQRTRDYVMNPGNELSELKSFFAAWYLGFNIPSAVQNMTQLPLWTLPYLSKRFGTPKAIVALTKATSDVVGSWKSFSRLTADEKAMIDHALSLGFIDESFATTVAQIGEGTALSRLSGTALRHRALNKYNHYAMSMFQVAEEFNRRATLLAAYRLNKQSQFVGAFDAQAFMAAREAVEITQNEYAVENRPEFMRGNKAIVFQFMHFVQNAIFQMSPMGDASWKRLLLVQLAIGGLMGLPFMGDSDELIKFLARRFGIHFEPELEVRKFLTELGTDPDWLLRGLSSQAGPFDLSYRFSLGNVIPGMQALGSTKPFAEAITDAVGDIGGAGMSAVLNAMKAATVFNQTDPWKRLEAVSPTFMKYVIQAGRALDDGGIKAKDGAITTSLTDIEAAGLAVGLRTQKQTHSAAKASYEIEMATYWKTRRSLVLHNIAIAELEGDREAIADAKKALRTYNEEARALDRTLVISRATIMRSKKQRIKVRRHHMATGSPSQAEGLTDYISSAYSEEE